MKYSEGGGVGGLAPVSSKVELAAKFWAKSSALKKADTAVEPSGWSKGKKDEKVKLLETLLVICQKSREELELKRF